MTGAKKTGLNGFAPMMKLAVSLVCGALLLSTVSGVVNNNANQSNQEAQRREAPLADSYGPPPATGPELPVPVYGAPAVAHYPPPPPDVPPPAPALPPVQVPHKEYGVPVQNYGPPNVNIEYGPPPAPAPKPIFHSYPKPQYHGPPPSHHKKSSSFLEQLFSTFGFGGGDDDHHSHHHHAPKPVYGPPSHPAPAYGPPAGPVLPPKPAYGPPVSAPQPVYGPPLHQAPPKPLYGPPKPAYGPPIQSGYAVQSSSFGHQSGSFGHHPPSPVHAPPTPPEIKCDGWKPIAGPVVQPEVHAPESSYGPPPSGDFLGTHHQLESSGGVVSTGDIGLQLPKLEHGPVFNSHSDLHAGLELSKGNSYEVHSNFISDSYGAPPADSFLPGKYKPSFAKPLPPPPPPPQKLHFPPAPHYGPPPMRHPGLGISHGSVSGNLKPWPVSGSPPRHPIAYRPPVPQGLIESIGHAVEHQENFGTKPAYSGDVYLPPPTRDVAHSGPSSVELNALPSEQPAKPFLTQHQLPEAQAYVQEPRYQSHDVVSVSSDCGHGPTSVDVQQSIQTNQLSIVGPSATASYSADYSNSNNIQEHYGESSSRHVQTSSLPGLDGGLGGLELISAQKSQSLTIPVQGQHGSYQLQFQSADPQGAGSAPHEQILSEGLLQSILSAIEQPQQHRAADEHDSYDPNIDHSEVSVFLKSPEGQKTLQDHPNGHIGHKR
ncbi:uncharacterized protein LOC128709400 [Anopheles marshallii]|uniref:uncharacterized protein LOC128709400 n=1 Tax=Anopheles marshallii TaxID=1521116 RepID=UPI00237C13B9|nr:uncharacterized protein LOC128709400 [Anopheles marshallii]